MRKLVVLALALGTAGAVFFGRRKSAGAAASPRNLTTVDGKLQALPVAAKVLAGGAWIFVATDEAHRKSVMAIVTKRARAKPAMQYVVIDMAFAREAAADRGAELEADAWGGVAAVRDGELLTSTFWKEPTTGKAVASSIDYSESYAGLEGVPLAPSIIAGILPARST